jgi:CHASE3 domain sensor protein
MHEVSNWFLGCLEKEINYHVAVERERILKLIEDWVNDETADFAKTIRLIKGETNERLHNSRSSNRATRNTKPYMVKRF